MLSILRDERVAYTAIPVQQQSGLQTWEKDRGRLNSNENFCKGIYEHRKTMASIRSSLADPRNSQAESWRCTTWRSQSLDSHQP